VYSPRLPIAADMFDSALADVGKEDRPGCTDPASSLERHTFVRCWRTEERRRLAEVERIAPTAALLDCTRWEAAEVRPSDAASWSVGRIDRESLAGLALDRYEQHLDDGALRLVCGLLLLPSSSLSTL